MKFMPVLFACMAPVPVMSETLPVRLSIGDNVFSPQGEISLRQNLRNLSTPPYTVLIAREDVEAFGRFTAAGVGQLMEVFVCDQVVLSAVVRVQITSRSIDIHNAPKGGLLDQFSERGCP